MRTSRILVALALASTLSLTACSIEKNGSHDNENVKISTPFGGMSVKTNENVVVAERQVLAQDRRIRIIDLKLRSLETTGARYGIAWREVIEYAGGIIDILAH